LHEGANFNDPGTWTMTSTPEPATWATFVLGVGGIGATFRTLRKAANLRHPVRP
jgi:hypothetical protein